MKKFIYAFFCVTILSMLALPARADIVLIELDYSGTANATVTNINPTTGWVAPGNPPFTVVNAAIAPFKSWVIGNATGSAPWTFDSTGTAVRNTDLYTASSYGGTSRLDMNPGLAATGQIYTINSVQIDVKAAATATRWQFAYQKAAGATNTLVGNVTITAQTSSDPITTYTIDLSSEGLTATEGATTWTISQGMRSLFYETTSGVNNDGFEVDAIRLIGTGGINTNGLVDGPELVDLSVCPPGVDQVDIYLLLGQSNMKGRGVVPPVQTDNPLIVNMNMADNLWYEARHPLHKAGVPDLIDASDNAGVGPGLDFARGVLSQTNGVRIALVPCAAGGSWIDLWAPGVLFYTNTIYRAQKALADGPPEKTRIKGILWLQGESDAIETRYAAYKSKLTNIVQHLRTDLNEPDLPFIACTIGSFINSNNYPRVAEINNALLSLPESEPITACVDARDLTGHIGDNMHYNTESQVIIGGRYADALQLISANSNSSPFVEWTGEGVDMTPELLVKYAIGGAANPTGASERVTALITESLFTLAAVIRTNDPQLSVVGQMTTNLNGLWENLTNHPYGIPSATQTNVTAGCERRDFSTPIAGDPTKFLRLRVVHSAP